MRLSFINTSLPKMFYFTDGFRLTMDRYGSLFTPSISTEGIVQLICLILGHRCLKIRHFPYT